MVNAFQDSFIGTYILDANHNVVVEHDSVKWGMWLETADRKVKEDIVHNLRVSTVFLGLDHSHVLAHEKGDTRPVVFETMIFVERYREVYQRRYCTWDEALVGHAVACLWCEPMAHPKHNDVHMWNVPHYTGAKDHVFVIVHVMEDSYLTGMQHRSSTTYSWVNDIHDARVFTHDETMETDLPQDGRWYAIGRRIYLD